MFVIYCARCINIGCVVFVCRLGPCELQDPLWAKMSAVAAGATKKRKKSDTKPQAQM